MNLAKTFGGAILGAAVAIGIYTVLKTQTEIEASWFPVVTGLLTGLGVRQAHQSLTGQVSYLRGAISGAIAAAAMLGAEQVVKYAVTQDVAGPAPAIANNGDAPQEDDGDEADLGGAPDLESVASADEMAHSTATARDGRTPAKPAGEEALPFLFMAVGIFLAYEFARGSEKAGVPPPEEPAEPVADAPAADATDDQSEA